MSTQHKGFIPIIAIVVVAIVAGAAGYYFRSINTSETPPASEEVSVTPTDEVDAKPESAPVQTNDMDLTPNPAPTPTEAYRTMKQAFEAASNFDAFAEVVQQYGSESQRMMFESEETQQMDSAMKERIVAFRKTFLMDEVIDIQEEISGDTAILYLNFSGEKSNTRGKVDMVLEGGEWKLELESLEFGYYDYN